MCMSTNQHQLPHDESLLLYRRHLTSLTALQFLWGNGRENYLFLNLQEPPICRWLNSTGMRMLSRMKEPLNTSVVVFSQMLLCETLILHGWNCHPPLMPRGLLRLLCASI